jgi:hypothetical protein
MAIRIGAASRPSARPCDYSHRAVRKIYDVDRERDRFGSVRVSEHRGADEGGFTSPNSSWIGG